jgi:hypothetical protein
VARCATIQERTACAAATISVSDGIC